MKLYAFLQNKLSIRRAAHCVAATASCALLALLVLVFVAGLAAAFTPAFTSTFVNASGARGTGMYVLRDSAARLVKPALFTIKQAFFSTLIALAVGFPAAFFLAHRKFTGRTLLSSLSAVPLAFPALLLAIGFVSVFGVSGVVNRILSHNTLLRGTNTSFLYSFYGIIIVQGFYNFPLVMKICADAWEKLTREEKNAAIMLGANPPHVFVTVTLVQLLPAILSSCALVFLFCYFSFIIVLLFGAMGVSTLEVAIYHAARSTVNIQAASGLALVETAIAMLITASTVVLQKKAEKSYGHSFNAAVRAPLKGAGERVAFTLLVCLIALFLLAPITSIVIHGINPHVLVPLLKNKGFYGAFKTTAITSTLSALLAVISAFAYCCFLAPRTWRHISMPRGVTHVALLQTLPVLPMAVSSVVMGFGVMFLVNRGNAAIYIVARAALLWSFAFKQIFPAFRRVSPDVVRAAKMLSPSTLDAVLSVFLPQTLRPILSAFAFCFAAAASDANLPLMLAIPRFDTLALYTYRLAGAYRLNQACAAGIMLIALSAGVFVLTDGIAYALTARTAHNRRPQMPRGEA
jgi:thiamine transport system permease protein